MNTLEPRPSKILVTLLWLSLIPSLLGQFFKVSHWPGASALMILGTFVIGFFYLPLFVVESWKTKETTKEKVILLLQNLIVFFFSLGFLLKIMHWPGAGFFYSFNNTILLFVVIPFALFQLTKARKLRIEKSHNVLLVMYFFCQCLGSLMLSSNGRIKIDTVFQQGLNTEQALKAATSRNKQLYVTINSIKSTNNNNVFSKAQRLQSLTDSTIFFIRSLKSRLVAQSDGISQSSADTIGSTDIRSVVEVDVPTEMLIGDRFNPNEGPYSALRLKSVINNCRDSLLNLVLEQNRVIIKEGLNLHTDNYTDEDGEPLSWEMVHFNNMPLLYVFNTLTNLQYEIKNAEYQVLTDIINSGDHNLNTALFSQISELNSKYAAVKKQEELKKLQKENEKGLLLLSAKDFELNNTHQTINYFIFAILAFLVLVFFIIRSNNLRKQANSALRQQKEIIELQKVEVEIQKHLVEEKQKEIIESISYAKRLQEAILPPREYINAFVPNNFIIYQPKDIVAGDFYWAEKMDHLFFIAAADSTGHGVPGAMVSVVCSNALNRTIKEFQITETGKILDKTRELVLETFEKSSSDVKDGMDISLLCIDTASKKVFWSGANNPLWYVQNNELMVIKADKQPIGKTDFSKPFTTHQIPFQENTTFYLFTDGFADQFGGPEGKKFKYKQLSDLLSKSNYLPSEEQKTLIENAFADWKGELEQIDDVCIIGLRI